MTEFAAELTILLAACALSGFLGWYLRGLTRNDTPKVLVTQPRNARGRFTKLEQAQ